MTKYEAQAKQFLADCNATSVFVNGIHNTKITF